MSCCSAITPRSRRGSPKTVSTAAFSAFRRAARETMFLEEDRLAILPEGHPLSAQERVPLAALCEEPFLLLERG